MQTKEFLSCLSKANNFAGTLGLEATDTTENHLVAADFMIPNDSDFDSVDPFVMAVGNDEEFEHKLKVVSASCSSGFLDTRCTVRVEGNRHH